MSSISSPITLPIVQPPIENRQIEIIAQEKRGLAYLCLLVFLFLLCGAVQSAIPALNVVKPAQVIATFAIVAGIMGKLTRREQFVLRTPSYFVLALMAITVMSVPGALWPSLALDTTIDALKMLAVFLLISNVITTPRKLNGIVWAMCIGGLLPAIGTIRNIILNENLADGYRGRWLGIYANPNDLAYAMAMLVPLAIALASSTKRVLAKLTAIGCTILYTITIVFTFSRMGFLCLMIIMLMTILRSQHRLRNFILLLILTIICLPFVSGRYMQRVETITKYDQDRSSVGRLEAWDAGLEMFENHPLLGVGAGCFILGWTKDDIEKSGGVRSAHNTFFQALGELGLFGFIFFCIFLISSWRLIRKLSRSMLLERRGLTPDIFKQRYGQLFPIATALDIGLCVFIVSSLTGGLLFTWYPYIFSAMGIAALEIYQKRLATEN